MAVRSPSLRSRIALLESIAFVAVEHERDLDLARLTGFIDLYATALTHAADGVAPPDFETFVKDRAALAAAAAHTARESGTPTTPPEPLDSSPAAP